MFTIKSPKEEKRKKEKMDEETTPLMKHRDVWFGLTALGYILAASFIIIAISTSWAGWLIATAIFGAGGVFANRRAYELSRAWHAAHRSRY